MTKKPIIGITLDWAPEGSFSSLPHFALREHYFYAVHKAGGLPIAIPYMTAAIDEYMEQIDGLLIPGGDFALLNEWYIDPSAKKPFHETPRVEFDVAMIKKALEKDMPVLGICAGMQILGGMFDCKLTPDIHSYLENALDHTGPRESIAHDVNITKGTVLHDIIGHDKIGVNTSHREAIVKTSDKVVINAVATDTTIKGLEIPNYKFVVGVQWHPELLYKDHDHQMRIFEKFIEAI